jgi:hypothetical protein
MTNKSQITIAFIAILAIIGAAVLIFYKSSSRGEVQSVNSQSSSLISVVSVSSSSSQMSSVFSSQINLSNFSSISKILTVAQSQPKLQKLNQVLMQPCNLYESARDGKCFNFNYIPKFLSYYPMNDSDQVFLSSNINDLAIYYRESIKSQIIFQDYWINAEIDDKKENGSFIVKLYTQENGENRYKDLPKFEKTYQFWRINNEDGEFEEVLNYVHPMYSSQLSTNSSQNAVTIGTITPTNPNYLVREIKTKTGCNNDEKHIIVAEFGCYYYFTFFNMYKPAVVGSYDTPDFQENNFVISAGDPQKLYRMLDQATKDYLVRYIDQIYSNRPMVQVHYAGLKSPGIHTVSFSVFDKNYLSGPGDVARFYTEYEVVEKPNEELQWRFDKFIAEM